MIFKKADNKTAFHMGVIVSNAGYFTSFHMSDSWKPLSILTEDNLWMRRLSFIRVTI